jgi:hypothetical protein
MDAAKNYSATKKRGNLNEDERTANSEPNSVTKIKVPEQRKNNRSADLAAQKQRLEERKRLLIGHSRTSKA